MTNIIMLQSVLDGKNALQKTVVDKKWVAWVECGDARVKAGPEACKAAVMDDRWYSQADALQRLAQ